MYTKLENAFQNQDCIYVTKRDNVFILNDLCNNIVIYLDKEKIKVSVQLEVFEFKSSERLYNKVHVLYTIYKFSRFFIYVKAIIKIILKFIKK